MSNVLVISFMPNITSHVQPLYAGYIQTSKAFFRKRHMAWVLEQLAEWDLHKVTEGAGKPRC